MKQPRKLGAMVVFALSVAGMWTWALEPGFKRAPKAEATAILNNRTLLRTWMVFRTPVVVGADGERKEPFTPHMHRGKLVKKKIGQYQSPLPDDAWREPGFDDSEWKRERVPVEKEKASANRGLNALHSATDSAMICARAKFLVSDPAEVGELRLSLKYVGGVAVFMNGKEVTRRHLPGGKLDPGTLAEQYPDDLYITADGKRMQHVTEDWSAYKRDEARFNRRYRELKDVAIPAGTLRKGLNVLVLQLHRAPVHEKATTVERSRYGGMGRTYGLWAYVGLRELSLSATNAAGIQPNLGRHPSGVRVWNCPPFATLRIDSFGDPGARPTPVEIDAVRGGTCSGRFVISSDRTIESLKVRLSDLRLKNGKAALPAESVRVRHAQLAMARTSPRPRTLFDALHAGVPARVEYGAVRLYNRAKRQHYNVNGAIVPVWISICPPGDASAGVYEGAVTVRAAGLEETVVPLRCRVHGWTLPDPVDRRVKTLNVFSPYIVAQHYEVPFWSDKHFALIETSFRLMAAINGRRVDVDLAPSLRYGNAPIEYSMFRLIPRERGEGYDYDFSAIERLFDVVERTIKMPLPLLVNCWGFDRVIDKSRKDKKQTVGWSTGSRHVPVRDPKTGKLTHVANPTPGSEENYTFWKPILDELRKRIEKRGWFANTAIGHQSYCWPPLGEQVKIAHRIWPDGAYGYSAHNGTLGSSFGGGGKVRLPVRYAECVWTQGKLQPRGYRRLLKPGREKNVWNSCSRNGHKDSSPLLLLLRKPEEMIMRGHDGLGYLCADFLPIENKKARRESQRYYQVEANVGGVMGYSTTTILAAGPDGPIATGRYEMFREGVQQCEAILYLQRALDGGKVEKALAARVNAYLDERSRKFLKSDWPCDRRELDRRLYALAAEVAAAE